jgi:hypothetical protein
MHVAKIGHPPTHTRKAQTFTHLVLIHVTREVLAQDRIFFVGVLVGRLPSTR